MRSFSATKWPSVRTELVICLVVMAGACSPPVDVGPVPNDSGRDVAGEDAASGARERDGAKDLDASDVPRSEDLLARDAAGAAFFELGGGESFEPLANGQEAPAVLGPQGSYHLELTARLSGDVRPRDLEFTEIRVTVALQETGDEIGSGYWAIDATLWETVDDGFESHLPPTFLSMDPVEGQSVALQADAKSDRDLGTLDLLLVFGPP